MIKQCRSKPLGIAFLALFLLAAFVFLLFHRHEDGGHGPECSACRLQQILVFLFILGAGAFLTAEAAGPKKFFQSSFDPFSSLLLAAPLNGRSPPFLF